MLVLALGLILVVTLRSVHAENDLELVPFRELVGDVVHGEAAGAREAVVGALGNVLLFVPLGIALALRRASIARVATAALLVSGSVELVQLLVPGRTTSVDDVLFNVFGAVLGHAVSTARAGPSTVASGAGSGRRRAQRLEDTTEEPHEMPCVALSDGVAHRDATVGGKRYAEGGERRR